MKKSISVFAALLIICFSATAQSNQQKIVFDFVKADTADFRIMVSQLKNVLKEAPETKLEVVCSGGGLFMLVADKSNVKDEIAELKNVFNVSFAACANSMRRQKVDKTQLVSQANVVPVAILELAAKEQEGWSYIKAGH